MNLIKNLLRFVIIMFIILFAIFFIYIFNDKSDKVIDKKPVVAEVVDDNKKVEQETVEDKIKIEPIMISEEVVEEPPVVLKVEPATSITTEIEEPQNNINKFYYNNLDNYSKLIYEALENQKDSLKTGNSTINISNKLGEAIDNGSSIEAIFSVAINAFEYDNPDIFYLDPSKMILYYEKNSFGNYKIYIKNDEQYSNYLINSFSGQDDIQRAQNEINDVVAKIEANVNSISGDYNKILYIHDWLTENVKYDETISRTNKDTIYGTLVEKEAVCGGYAKTFAYILDRTNIKSIIIQGVGTNEQGQENHAWNYVSLNNKWYGIDCTWDDPIIVGDAGSSNNKKYYTYFLKGQNVFNVSHRPFNTFYGTDLKINYPQLNSEDY